MVETCYPITLNHTSTDTLLVQKHSILKYSLENANNQNEQLTGKRLMQNSCFSPFLSTLSTAVSLGFFIETKWSNVIRSLFRKWTVKHKQSVVLRQPKKYWNKCKSNKSQYFWTYIVMHIFKQRIRSILQSSKIPVIHDPKGTCMLCNYLSLNCRKEPQIKWAQKTYTFKYIQFR